MGHSNTKTQTSSDRYSVYMPIALHDAMEEYAARHNMTKGESYRLAMQTLLELDRRGVEITLDAVRFSVDPASTER